ncbi:hypothetical protein [Castellaniella sp.]|uniref:hypothetical protein n=1 Tax=Castellaniella sp. TaxID=1955812 RepID=UPI002AFEA693|nr:hypothetical protein [Castellaniella sp.]
MTFRQGGSYVLDLKTGERRPAGTPAPESVPAPMPAPEPETPAEIAPTPDEPAMKPAPSSSRRKGA